MSSLQPRQLDDWFGAITFAGHCLEFLGHGTLRYLATGKGPKHRVKPTRVYVLSRTFASGTGSNYIHSAAALYRFDHPPAGYFGAFSFRGMVTIHNVLAVISL